MANTIDDKELDDLIHNMYDPGCEKATMVYDKVGMPDDELYTPMMLVINAHREYNGVHEPDCFVNRPIN